MIVCSALLVLGYAVLVFWYWGLDHFSDHIEASIASVSWIFKTHGKPLYHAIDSADRYSMMYGPMLYIIYGAFLQWLGPSILSMKLIGGIPSLLSLMLLFFVFKKKSGWPFALFLTASLCLSYLFFGTIAFCARGDSIILLGISLILFCLDRSGRFFTAFVTALVLGIVVNLKIHAILYYLPIFIFLFEYLGARLLAGALFAAAVIAIAPFLLSPQIDFQNYWFWLHETGLHNGFFWESFEISLETAIFFLFPVLTFWVANKNIPRKAYYFFLALCVVAFIISVISSAGGAGSYHLIPLFAFIAYLAACLWKTKKEILTSSRLRTSALIAFGIVVMVVTAGRQFVIWKIDRPFARLHAAQDVQRILQAHPGTEIAMGYGGDYHLSFYHPILTFAGNPFRIDAVVLMDMQAAGIAAIPSKTLRILEQCHPQIWMIPKGAQPFDVHGIKWPHLQLFSGEFKNIFHARYEMKEHSDYFDLWFCKNKALTQ